MQLSFADLSPASEVKRVLTRSYTTRPPMVANSELIPQHVRDQMSAAWDRRFVPEGAVSMHRLADCFVVAEGLVFDRTGALVRPTLTQHSPAEAEAGFDRIRAALAGGSVPSLPSALLCCKRGAANYGHWLVEMLPVAHLGLRWGVPEAARLLAPLWPGRLADIVREGFDMLGIGPERLHPCGDPVHVQELFLVDGLAAHGISLSPLVLEALDALAADVAKGPFDRVWVSREASPRRLADETEICRALHAKGWAVAAPELFGFRQQIALFRGATRIAGVSGAGLANLVFAPRGAEITAFAPASMPDTFFWLLSELGGKHYREIRCPHVDGPRGIEPWDTKLGLSLREAIAGLE